MFTPEVSSSLLTSVFVCLAILLFFAPLCAITAAGNSDAKGVVIIFLPAILIVGHIVLGTVLTTAYWKELKFDEIVRLWIGVWSFIAVYISLSFLGMVSSS